MVVPMPPMPPVTYATFCVMFSLLFCAAAVPRAWSPWRPRSIGFARSIDAECDPSTLDGQRDTHAAADAQRSDALLRVAALHFMQQRDQDAAARCTDRVTDGDRSAVD